jgi:glutamine synthetase
MPKETQMSREEILAVVEKRGIRFIRLMFCDIVGFPKCVTIASDELETVLENGQGFDGSSVVGFTPIYESDMIAMPDTSTFKVLPWDDDGDEALFFCDVLEPDRSPYQGDPRSILKRALARIERKGWSLNIGPELEYFYFTDVEDPQPLDHAGYFDLTPPDLGESLRKKTILSLEAMGVSVECSHHEVAPSQHEIDLRYGDALRIADDVILSKLMIKEIALRECAYATFMPKPIVGENGTGMHIHQSLVSDGKNLFYDAADDSHLSDFAKSYVEGLLRHAPEITLITNQWVNSYKRLVPGYEAPVYISWARMNRSTLVRVPRYRPGHEKATRIELRNPDPSCNPYLTFAVMLSAGLKGVEEGLTLRDPIEENIFAMSQAEREKRGIGMLPGDLYEALDAAKKSDLVRETLGEHTFQKLIEGKTAAWEEYRSIVTPYELMNDLPVL